MGGNEGGFILSLTPPLPWKRKKTALVATQVKSRKQLGIAILSLSRETEVSGILSWLHTTGFVSPRHAPKFLPLYSNNSKAADDSSHR